MLKKSGKRKTLNSATRGRLKYRTLRRTIALIVSKFVERQHASRNCLIPVDVSHHLLTMNSIKNVDRNMK